MEPLWKTGRPSNGLGTGKETADGAGRSAVALHAASRRQHTVMKTIVSVLLIVLLISSNGCMTNNVIQDARGHETKALWLNNHTYDPNKVDSNKSEPAYYLLVPLTFPADVVISPVEFCWWLSVGWHT
jgi:hypothetical protein